MDLQETVPVALDGERLDRVVSLLTGISRSRASAAIEEGLILIDDEPVLVRSRRVQAGEELTVPDLPESEALRLQPDPGVEVSVVHEDAEVIVVDKAAGVIVHPGAGHDEGTLVHGILARYPEVASVGPALRPGIVHRLDRGTSGLLMVARTATAHAALARQLSDRRVDRRYLALVHGCVEADEGRIEAPIGRSPRGRTRMAVVVGGREARTAYTVQGRWERPGTTLLECRLETGRTHQIRVHLTAIGHPLVGDAAYDSSRDHHGPGRPFLHAAHLGFVHPSSGAEMAFDSSLPADLSTVLAGLAHPLVCARKVGIRPRANPLGRGPCWRCPRG